MTISLKSFGCTLASHLRDVCITAAKREAPLDDRALGTAIVYTRPELVPAASRMTFLVLYMTVRVLFLLVRSRC